MPEKTELPVKYSKVNSFQGESSTTGIQLTPMQQRAVKQVEELFNQGWNELEIEEVLIQQRDLDYRPQNDTERITTAFIPVTSGISNVPLLSKISRYTRSLDKLTFQKKRQNGVGFKVTCDISGNNAIVSKITDPRLLEQGLCVGAVVTHIDDLEVTSMDHFEILDKYRKCNGAFSMVFAVPGLRPHTYSPEVVRKSGHKLTSFLLILSCFLSIAALTYNEIHVGEVKNFPCVSGDQGFAFSCEGRNIDLKFRWNEIDILEGSTTETHSYKELQGNPTHGAEWEQVTKPGALFFGCTIASIVLYIFLLLLSIILASRRPKSLIEESGETIRSVFIILNMIVCLTTLSTWAAWISEFDFPGSIKVGDSWVEISEMSTSNSLSTSLILMIVASFFMLVSIFTAVIQK